MLRLLDLRYNLKFLTEHVTWRIGHLDCTLASSLPLFAQRLLIYWFTLMEKVGL